MSRLIGLYPKAWRDRYGEEFAAILADRPLGPFDVADVVLGALDARLHFRGLDRTDLARRPVMSPRIGGYAAIAGGVLWLIVFLATVLQPDLGAPGFLVIVVATASLLVAITGLSAFQARRYPALVWVAFLVPALGASVSILGVFAMLVVGDRPFIGDASPWYMWMLGTAALIIGSGLFAFATWRVDALPRSAAVILAVGAVAIVPVLGGLVGSVVPEPAGRVLTLLAMVAFSGGWVGLGAGAIRLDRAASGRLTSAAP
jgi:hypothetical protein